MRGLSIFLALGLGLGVLTGCSRSAPSQTVVLKVASQRGGTKAMMEAAGALGGTSYRIEWSEFPSAQALLEALGAGAVDVGAVSDAPFTFAYASGAQIKAVQGILGDRHGLTTAILAPAASPIRTVADLKGKRVATVRGSVGHYLLVAALARAGLKPSDIAVVYLAPGDAKAALSTGAIDAWSTWNPYLAMAVLQDHDRVIADNRGLTQSIAFEAANDSAIAAKRGALADFLGRLSRAERWAASHDQLFAQALAKDTGLPADVALMTARNYHLQPVALDADLEARERQTLAVYQAAGVIQTPPDVHAELDPTFNAAAAP